MKRFGRALVVCVTAWGWSISDAGSVEADRNLRVTVDLSDGSRIIGASRLSAVPVQTPYAKMDIPLAQLRSLRFEADRENASLALANGDRIRGVVTLGAVELDATFGKVTIGIEHVRGLTVRRDLDSGLAAALRDMLVLHYAFDRDEGGTVADGSGKARPGSVVRAKWTADGKVGGAYEFNGRTDYITTPPVETQGDATWSVWIYPRSFPAAHDTYAQFLGVRGRAWVWNSDNTSLSYSRQNHHGGSSLALQFVVQGREDTSGSVVSVFPALPEAKRWYHVVGVFDASGMHLYLDGKLQGESANRISIPVPCPLIVGANDNGPQRYFDGMIDEIMVFKKGLSADEVATLYESQK